MAAVASVKAYKVHVRCTLLVITLALMAESRTTTSPPPPTTTTIPFTTPPGCFQNGKWYHPGEEMSRDFDGKNWCYGTICEENGQVSTWDNFNCGTTAPTTVPPSYGPKTPQTTPELDTTTPPPPVTTIPFTTPPGCFQNGKYYRRGEEMSRGFDGENWCYGTYCDQNGQVVPWDNFKCGATTPTPHIPTTTPTTLPLTTTRIGCFQNGKWYLPGEEMSLGFDGKNWCFGTYCGDNGQIIAMDGWECETTPPPDGCFKDGKRYRPGEQISRGFDGKNWCFGTYCDDNGQIIAWDNFKCGPTTVPTTRAPTTVPTTHARTTIPTTHVRTTIPTTHEPNTAPGTNAQTTIQRNPIVSRRRARLPGCYYRGNRYEPNSDILQSTNGNGWCYGRRCSDDNQIIFWDDFTCQATKSGGCWYGGYQYAYGTELFRIRNQFFCYGGVCGKNGKIKAWTRMSCQKERQFHGGRLKPSWCKYRGEVYPRGSVFAVKSLSKRYGFGWCMGAKCVADGRIVTWGPKWAPGYC